MAPSEPLTWTWARQVQVSHSFVVAFHYDRERGKSGDDLEMLEMCAIKAPSTNCVSWVLCNQLLLGVWLTCLCKENDPGSGDGILIARHSLSWLLQPYWSARFWRVIYSCFIRHLRALYGDDNSIRSSWEMTTKPEKVRDTYSRALNVSSFLTFRQID